jgi:hypothetical protein
MVSELATETTYVSETFETELSTVPLPLSVLVVLGLHPLTTNLSN